MACCYSKKKNIPVKSVRSEKNPIRFEWTNHATQWRHLFQLVNFLLFHGIGFGFFFGGGFIVDVVSAEATTWCKYCAVLVALKRNLFDRHNAAILDRSTTIRISHHLPLAMTTSLLSAPQKIDKYKKKTRDTGQRQPKKKKRRSSYNPRPFWNGMFHEHIAGGGGGGAHTRTKLGTLSAS